MIMDRCIVKGCSTNSLNNTINIKPNLFFKVPNDPDVSRKWCTALGQILEPGNKVCEIHFKEDDILKNLSTFTKLDGQKTLTFRKRVKLKRDAVPISPIPKDPLEIEQSDHWLEDELEHISEDDVQNIDDDNIDEFNTYLSQLNNGDGAEEDNKDDDQDIVTFNEEDELNIDSTIYEDDSQKVIQQNVKEKVMDKYKKNGIIKQIIQSSGLDGINSQTQRLLQKRKLDIFSPKNKLSELGVSPDEQCLTQNKIRKIVFSYRPSKPFACFDELKYIVQHRCIRQQWCAKVEQSSVFFSYVDFDVSRVNCCLEVTENFKVNAYTADKVIAIYVATTDGIKNITEIIEIMKVLEKKRWCIGPGVPNVNRSPDCIGAMPPKSMSVSCFACVKEKLDSLSHTRELATCRIKLEESRHKYELMRKKHHYANVQYERLKSENKILELQVDDAKKIAINEVLDRLPTLQQCVVRYIIHSSYTVKSALRYSETWLNECHVMRAISSALYEYIRHKEILPLPCLDTLKKHKLRTNEQSTSNDFKTQDLDITAANNLKLPEPELLECIPDPIIVIKSAEDCELPVITESIDTTETSEIPVSTDMPESTNTNEYGLVDILPECIISEDVAYEVTVSTEPFEEEY
ncbi:uncharacterized protein LOC131670073 [Phymastichus coffea]|uniref:uncharacterized protein LOC131670073 n=1 Tax=Phymastichus coffea TaxID=108790 RepID=UPI00273B1B02|nr:uncharacterized protein LOC131670073 [Phymastichus coffea]